MKRELIIVPNEEIIKDGVWCKSLTEEERHGKGIEEYSNIYNLGLNEEIVGVDNYNGYFWGIALAKLGHISLHVDNELVVYIPEIVTKGQYKFFKKHKNFIDHFRNSVSICFICKENEEYQIKAIESYGNDDEISTPIQLFYDELKLRYNKIDVNSKGHSK